MNSLNQKKATKAACWRDTAPFRAVYLIKRGGLPLRIPCLALSILLTGCASMTTVKLKPTDTIRNSTTTENSELVFQVSRKAGTRNPYLEIAATYRVAKEESYQRRFN